MSQPIILPSVLLPRQHAELIKRPRLHEKLHDLLENKLILVTTAAGYGKTALLVDFAHDVDMPVCWYTIDRHDVEFQRFLAHFTAALLRVFPDFAQQARAYIDIQNAPCPDPEGAAAIIINELHQHVSDHFIFVLDDFDQVNDEVQITQFVNCFVQYVGDHCHLIIASQHGPKLPDLELVFAHSQAGILPQHDFLFAPEEVQLLVTSKYKIHLSPSEAEELALKIEGWVTALMLAEPFVKDGKVIVHWKNPRTPIDLQRYWDHFFDRLPEPLQYFLLSTSVFDQYNAPLCARVLSGIAYPEEKDWEGMIHAVIQENAFLTSVGEENTWFRYHLMFRDYLQHRLEKSQPNLRFSLMHRLADAYEEQQEWEKAHSIYVSLGNLEATLDFIERANPFMVRHGRYEALSAWIKPLATSKAFQKRPCLVSLQGNLETMGSRVVLGLELLNQAETALRNGTSIECLARTLVRRSSAHHFLGDYQAALQDAREALTLAESNPDLTALKAQALRAHGSALNNLGQTQAATNYLEDSLALYQSLDDLPNVASLQKELGIAYRKVGRLGDALSAYQTAQSYWCSTGSLHRLADLYNNMGVMHHYAGNYEQAVLALNDALALSREYDYARLEAFALASIGDIYADLNAPQQAYQAYEQASQVARRIKHRSLPAYLEIAKAELNLDCSQGDINEAARCVQSAERLIQLGNSYDHGWWMLIRGRLALARGETEPAIRNLREAQQVYQESYLPFEKSNTHLYLAAAYYQSGDLKVALKELELAFETANQIDSDFTLVISGRQHRELLKFASQSPGCATDAQRLLDHTCKFDDKLPGLRRNLRSYSLKITFAPPTLIIHALGESRIELDEKELTTADWKSQAQREFFYYLLAHPDGVTRQKLERVFWPDQEKSNRYCENMIRRLRDTFGNNAIICDTGRYKFNQALDYRYDVEVFLKNISRARTLKDPAQKAAAYKEAVKVYGGKYLEDASGGWVISIQKALEDAWLEASLHLADYYLGKKEYQETIRYCGRVLQFMPGEEPAHRILMKLFAMMGNRSKLISQYKVCEQFLRTEHRATPSTETQALYRLLLRD